MKRMKIKRLNNFLIICLFLSLFGCYRVPDRVDPHLSCYEEESYIQTLKNPFTSLSDEEKKEDWGREYTIALGFAKDYDLYQAISSFKRADFLLKATSPRKLEMKYFVLLCYYLGKKYEDAILSFEKSDLAYADNTFLAFHDLLTILYDCYQKVKDPQKEARILEILQKKYPETAKNLTISSNLTQGNMADLQGASPSIDSMIASYNLEKKSVASAQALNAFIPGAGYLYCGQKNTALTALVVNALFIVASYEFFHHGYLAAGIITSSLEAGWYFGGIYGAGQEAKFYNERIYEKKATALMTNEKLFPVLMVKYAF